LERPGADGHPQKGGPTPQIDPLSPLPKGRGRLRGLEGDPNLVRDQGLLAKIILLCGNPLTNHLLGERDPPRRCPDVPPSGGGQFPLVEGPQGAFPQDGSRQGAEVHLEEGQSLREDPRQGEGLFLLRGGRPGEDLRPGARGGLANHAADLLTFMQLG
jgi:hypothetical protein